MSISLKPSKYKHIDISFDEDFVSSDILSNPATGILDASATSLSADGYTLTLYVWYDNEYGYSMQVLGFASYLAKEHMGGTSANEYVNDSISLLGANN